MTYADWMEDDWLLNLFPDGFQGYACEVGAYDGQTHSTTLLLEQHGWTCLCIEPNPAIVKKLKLRRPFVIAAACGSEPVASAPFYVHSQNMEALSALKPVTDNPVSRPFEEPRFLKCAVEVKTLDQCLELAGFVDLDVLTVDTEGHELEVFKGCDLGRWKPKAIVSEAWDKDNPVRPYLAERGYKLVRRIGVNDTFLRSGWIPANREGSRDVHATG